MSSFPFSRFRPWLLSLLVLFLFGLNGPVSAQGQTTGTSFSEFPPDIRTILERGELIVAMPHDDLAPFFYMKNGEMQGTDVDLARGLALVLQVKLRFHREATSFNSVFDIVAQGKADVGICKLSRTYARARRVRFSEPYLTLRHALAVNQVSLARMTKTDNLPNVIQNFSGSIGVFSGTAFVDSARRNFPKAKIIEFTSWDEAIDAVKHAKLDAVYRDEFEIQRLMQTDTRNSLALRTVIFTDTLDPLAMTVRHDSHQLLSLINLYLSQRAEPMTVKTLLKRIQTP